MANILVTGSSGFIGKYLIENFLKGYNVFTCDKKDNFEVLDITKNYIIDNKINIVIHLAAQTSVWNEDHLGLISDNITSFIHIFNLCKELNIKFIYASSSCSINVTSMYGLTKSFTDNYVNIYNFEKCVGLRFHNVYGKNSRENTLLGVCLNNNQITLWNNGRNYRHFTYIDDVCRAILKSFNLPKGLYNVVNPQVNSVVDFVSEVKKYKNIEVTLIDAIREFDKDIQWIDNSIPNIIEEPTPMELGIKYSI